MPASVKKSKSRRAFEEVFEEQARRFSAFDLLGLSVEAPSSVPDQPPPPPTAAWLHVPPPQGEEPKATGAGTNEAQLLGPDRPAQKLVIHRKTQKHRPDRPAEDLRLDRTVQGQTVRPKSLGQTVRPSLGRTPAQKIASELGPDRPVPAVPPAPTTVVLAPLQWKVWVALQEVEATGQLTSYRQLAKQVHSTIDGVRKAVRVLKKEGGVIAKETVRSVDEQGFRVALNRQIAFRPGTLSEAKGILKRGLNLGQTPDRPVPALGPDGLCMYVCKNIYIKQTDIAQLLRISPPEWDIREQTLLQIADLLPTMTAIEFRLSLLYLIEQARTSREPIRNPNAWIKAAFEKNGAPLVTEREIEARFERRLDRQSGERSQSRSDEKSTKDLEVLRQYIMASVEERTVIDRMAEERAAPLLKVVAEDKRAGVIEEAKVEAAREFFARQPRENREEIPRH